MQAPDHKAPKASVINVRLQAAALPASMSESKLQLAIGWQINSARQEF